MSKTQKLKMQKILNRGIRFINLNHTERLTIEETHKAYNITPLNIFTHMKATKIWETVKLTHEEEYEELVRPRNRSHSWYPRTSTVIEAPLPVPIYTSNS